MIKYWLRLSNLEENKLLKAAYTADVENNQNGGQSWVKIKYFLLKITAMNGCKRPINQIEIKDFLKNIQKKKLISMFDESWDKTN